VETIFLTNLQRAAQASQKLFDIGQELEQQDRDHDRCDIGVQCRAIVADAGNHCGFQGLRGIELTTSQAHREDDIGSLTAINMTLTALLVMVSFGSGLGQKIIVE
jgi:hypothetical protein